MFQQAHRVVVVTVAGVRWITAAVAAMRINDSSTQLLRPSRFGEPESPRQVAHWPLESLSQLRIFAMTYVDAPTLTCSSHAALGDVRRSAVARGLFQCLIVAEGEPRRQLLTEAAERSGWEAVACGDPQSAIAAQAVMHFQLALVDLAGQSLADYSPLLERLSSQGGLLLLACGSESSAREEILARQLGAWVYLPGVEMAEQVSPLCTEARSISEKARLAHNTRSRIPRSTVGRSARR